MGKSRSVLPLRTCRMNPENKRLCSNEMIEKREEMTLVKDGF